MNRPPARACPKPRQMEKCPLIEILPAYLPPLAYCPTCPFLA